MQFISNILTPRKIINFSDRVIPFLLLATIALLAVGLIYALAIAPADYQQGSTVKIMYIHVPSAWLSLAVYALMSILSIGYLVWRNPASYLIAKAIAPIGACFCFICLLTGAIWAKPMWGAWWVWDARLTSVLLLFFIYVGYIILTDSFSNKQKEASSASILCVIGMVNIPIIKFSVDWWNTQHQPASFSTFEKLADPAIHNTMLLPLIIMLLAFVSVFMLIALVRIKTALLQKELAGKKLKHK